MIIYENTKAGFFEDVRYNVIDDKIYALILEKMGRRTSKQEVASWISSLNHVKSVLEDKGIPDDIGIAVEYNLPYTSKRVDIIISGKTEEGLNSAVVMELKQWSEVERYEGSDSLVRVKAYSNNGTTHPSYQAWSYVSVMNDFNEEVQLRPIELQPCVFLHNYVKKEDDPLTDPVYGEYLQRAPVFIKTDVEKLSEFIKKFIRYGDNRETLYLIENGRLRPSKSLQDSLVSMMDGNEEFTLLDQQKVIFEKALLNAKRIMVGNKKRVMIIEGGPGTGKSVLAINLMVKLTKMDCVTRYVTKNQAPRSVYHSKLRGEWRSKDIRNMFSGSGVFSNAEKDVFDVLVVDEAHRLNEKSGRFQNLGENQIKEIINSSKYSIFFVDEFQRVTLKDIGTVSAIKKIAERAGAKVEIEKLESQFRCNGSDGYLEWLNDVLQIEETANFNNIGSLNYDIRVFSDPNELRLEIEKKNALNNKSRLVAGYCWDWISHGKNRADVHDIVIPEHGFEMSWNLGSTETWAIDEASVNEVGCIHTCQGLEFDYIGVIIGNDLRYEDGRVITDYTCRAKTDSSLKGLKKNYGPQEREFISDSIIRNTYRTLMSRGMKGCYVYCVDNGLENYFKQRILK